MNKRQLDKKRREVLAHLDALPNEPIHVHFTKKRIRELAREIAQRACIVEDRHEQETKKEAN